VLVPDGVLHRLPFAALRDPRTHRLLIESHQLASVPSATLARDVIEHEATMASSPVRHVLVVADPQAGSNLSALEGAEREGASLAGLYSGVQLLTRENATKATFIQLAPFADIIHFAGHGVATPDYPLLAHLEFALEVGVTGSNELTADEIAALQLSRTRLVILAACRTGTGAIRRGEGPLSLARPFLIAGVPSVIATLWDIEDRASAQFGARLHAQIASGVSPAQALQRAQLSMIGTDSPSVWAGFVLIGSPGPLRRNAIH
jgi:CHAT domain-containing protein